MTAVLIDNVAFEALNMLLKYEEDTGITNFDMFIVGNFTPRLGRAHIKCDRINLDGWGWIYETGVSRYSDVQSIHIRGVIATQEMVTGSLKDFDLDRYPEDVCPDLY